jgi:UDP-N-acetylmuramoylalanine--D-glutamate ligase
MDKLIVVLGAGESGVGAAILAKEKGFEVFVSDNGKIKDNYRDVLLRADIHYEESGHTENLILNADEIIKSPGIPDKASLIQKIKASQIPMISDIEFAARYTNSKKICITGSNGKTTTTLLIYHILKNAGINAGLAGNVGQSFALQVAYNNFDWYVLEISSFQLDYMFDFKADIAVLTNITPDHLDRYEYKFENYIDSKFRIIRNQAENDAFIYCSDDEVTACEIEKRQIKAKRYPFTYKGYSGYETAWMDDKILNININNDLFTMTYEELALQGRHNVYNSMAAGISARLVDIRKEDIKQSLSDFRNVGHRMEKVARIHGIEFINDSKATNVNSTWYALEEFKGPIIWIAGGIDKGNDYSKLFDLVKSKVKVLICLGEDNTRLIESFADKVSAIYETSSMDQAVLLAYSLGKKDDTVLLSPTCASFDLFENYEDRGGQFIIAVKSL